MTCSIKPVSLRPHRRNWFWLLPLLAGWLPGATLAGPAVDAPPRALTFAFDGPIRLTGNGLLPWQPIDKAPATGWLEDRSTGNDAGQRATALDGALSKLDAGHREGAFQFDLSRTFGAEQHLVLRSRLHVTRQAQGIGMQRSQANPYRTFPELALAWRLRHDIAIGAEYRFRPDNRNPAGPFGAQPRDGAWKDLFFSWHPSRHFSLTASYVDLGRLTPTQGGARQSGHYLTAEFWF